MAQLLRFLVVSRFVRNCATASSGWSQHWRSYAPITIAFTACEGPWQGCWRAFPSAGFGGGVCTPPFPATCCGWSEGMAAQVLESTVRTAPLMVHQALLARPRWSPPPPLGLCRVAVTHRWGESCGGTFGSATSSASTRARPGPRCGSLTTGAVAALSRNRACA